MSTSEIDEFVEAFLDRVTAGGDVKKASAAIQLFLDDVKGMKKEAAGGIPPATPSPFRRLAPGTALPPPAAPTTSPEERLVQEERDRYNKSLAANPIQGAGELGVSQAPTAPAIPGVAPSEVPGWEKHYIRPDHSSLWEQNARNPSLLVRQAIMDRQSRNGEDLNTAFRGIFGEDYSPDALRRVTRDGGLPDAKDPELLRSYRPLRTYANLTAKSDAMFAARKELGDSAISAVKGLAGRAKALVADAAARQKAVAGSREVRGRWQDMVDNYTGGIRKDLAQRKSVDTARSAMMGDRMAERDQGYRGAHAARLTAAQDADEIRATAAKEQDVMRQLEERETSFDRYDKMLRSAHDERVDGTAGRLRKELDGLNKTIETGPIPQFKNMPQLTPVNQVSEDVLARRNQLQAELAQVEQSRIRPTAASATAAPALASQKGAVQNSIANRQAARTARYSSAPPVAAAKPVARPPTAAAARPTTPAPYTPPRSTPAPAAWAAPKPPSPTGLNSMFQSSPATDFLVKKQSFSGAIENGLDRLTGFAKESPAAYGAGLGALVGGASTVLSSRRKDGSKPWLRNMLLGGLAGGALLGGLNRLSKWAPQPAAPLSTAPKGP